MEEEDCCAGKLENRKFHPEVGWEPETGEPFFKSRFGEIQHARYRHHERKDDGRNPVSHVECVGRHERASLLSNLYSKTVFSNLCVTVASIQSSACAQGCRHEVEGPS
jgi:hypothetical protein